MEDIGGVVVENQVDVRAVMERTLPKYVIIQSNQNHRYLSIYKNQFRDLPNALLFEGDYSFGLKTRFEVVPATTETGLVHIRSLQNRRYLTYFGTTNGWIAAMAVEPEEDQSKEYCTLFQPVFLSSDNNRVARLRHVNTGNYVRRFDGNGDVNRFVGCLTLLPEQRPDDNTDVFTFIDRETVVVLPDRIRLKHTDGRNLQACNRDGLRFRDRADNNSSSMFDYEVIPSRDGGVRLKSVRFGKYWTEMSGFLTLVCLQEAANPTTHEPDTVFIPTIDGGNCIGFRCLKSNFPVTFRGNMIPLVGLPRLSIEMAFQARAFAAAEAATNPACRWCYMKIEESAVSRKIDNVIYDLTAVRRYNEKTSALVTDDSSNRTQLFQTSEISLKTMVCNESKWSTSVSVSQTVKMSLKMDFPSFNLAGSAGSIDISNQGSRSYNWGETETSSVEVGSVRTVTVPPMSRVKATLMETRISYDIPFSYRQTDVFMDGSTKVTEKDDGIFTGHNGYGYSYELNEIPLEP